MKNWMWIAIAIVAIILIVLAVKKLKKKGGCGCNGASAPTSVIEETDEGVGSDNDPDIEVPSLPSDYKPLPVEI